MPLPRLIFVNRVYHPSTAATAQLLTDLAEGLAGIGWTVHVVATGEAAGEVCGVVVHRTGPGTVPAGLASRLVNSVRFLRAARRILAALLRPGDIVVPMTDPPLLGPAVARIAEQAGALVVPWLQDIYPEIATAHFGAGAALFFRPLQAWRDASWRRARHGVTLGPEMQRHATAHAGPGEKISLVPNWAPRELDVPASPAAVAAQRAAWGCTDQFVVAYSGNLGRVHEFATILAAAELLRNRSDIVFLFIGSGARFEAVRTAIGRRGLANVRLLPPEPRANLAVSLAAADAQLVTLRPEFAPLVFPSKLAGVLAAGRPVLFVGPTGGTIAGLLAQGPGGAAVAPGDAAGLAEVIAAWRPDRPRCELLGRHARALYEREFTFATARRRWDGLLRGIAGVEPRPAPRE